MASVRCVAVGAVDAVRLRRRVGSRHRRLRSRSHSKVNSRRRNVAACDLQIRLDAGADLNARSDTGTLPLHVAALVCQDPDAIKLLIKAGANIDAIDPSSGFTSLFFAARNSNRVATRVLLEAGAEASATLHDGRTPLHVAAEYAKEPPTFLVPADSTREEAETAAGFLADWRDRFPQHGRIAPALRGGPYRSHKRRRDRMQTGQRVAAPERDPGDALSQNLTGLRQLRRLNLERTTQGARSSTVASEALSPRLLAPSSPTRPASSSCSPSRGHARRARGLTSRHSAPWRRAASRPSAATVRLTPRAGR